MKITLTDRELTAIVEKHVKDKFNMPSLDLKVAFYVNEMYVKSVHVDVFIKEPKDDL